MSIKFRMYLVKARFSEGYSMRKVSGLVGISHQHYSRIESGYRKCRVSFFVMGKIAIAPDVSLDELWEGEYKYLLEHHPEVVNKERYDD